MLHAQAAALARLEDASQPQVDEAGAAEILEGTEGASRLGSRLGTVNRQAAMWRDARTLDQCSSAAGISAAVPRAPSPTVEAAAASAVTVTPQAPAGLPQQATMRPMRLGLSRKRILTEIAATGAPFYSIGYEWLQAPAHVATNCCAGMQATQCSLCMHAAQSVSSRCSLVAVSEGSSDHPCEHWQYPGSSSLCRPAIVATPCACMHAGSACQH